MQAYQPLSSRRWYSAAVRSVRRLNNEAVGFDFDILNDPQQTGRTIIHESPTILAPNSPLYKFLTDGFGIQLNENESLDLASLVGRVVELRFTKAVNGQEQAIAAIRPGEGAAKGPGPGTLITDDLEDDHGLG
jgi:hypothetical protein